MAAIDLDGVSKRYGAVLAVDDVSITVGDGQYHALVGPNGSGKTTLIRLLLGLTRPSAGSVSRGDVTVGCGFQSPNFYETLTVRENLDVFARMVGPVPEDWRDRVVAELRLERALDRIAGELSGGFARKLDLALALLKRPDVLVLDEPLGALDDVSANRLLEFLAAYRDDGHSVLVSTHNVAEFEPALDRVSIMHEGSIVVDAPPAAIDRSTDLSLQEYYVELVLDREG